MEEIAKLILAGFSGGVLTYIWLMAKIRAKSEPGPKIENSTASPAKGQKWVLSSHYGDPFCASNFMREILDVKNDFVKIKFLFSRMIESMPTKDFTRIYRLVDYDYE